MVKVEVRGCPEIGIFAVYGFWADPFYPLTVRRSFGDSGQFKEDNLSLAEMPLSG
ncbi:MAG: hypothetical protein NZ602_12415 [Thermoguttaceae bacterium]|nr:hypothetical protein [Thermoguttaceae bacterium]